jgi:hypothetical protein
MRNRAQLVNVRYLGGHWHREKPADRVRLVFSDDAIEVIFGFSSGFTMSWDAVADLIIEGSDQASKRLQSPGSRLSGSSPSPRRRTPMRPTCR